MKFSACYVFQDLGVRSGKFHQNFRAETGVKNGNFHKNFTLLGRGAEFSGVTCEGSWIIDGEEFALTIGTVSILSFNPLSLAARSLTEGTTSNDELPTAPPTGVYGCARLIPLVGELAGTSDPSEMGTSAGSLAKVLRRGGSGTRDLPLSFRSSSARLVLALMRLFTLGLWDDPAVSCG